MLPNRFAFRAARLFTVRGCLLAISLLAVSDRASAQPFDCEGAPTVPGEQITLELLASNLSDPVDVTHAPGDETRLFLVEQRGRVIVFDLVTESLVSTAFLDIRSKVRAGGERGLLGIAFHPSYETNGHFFVHYTRSPDGASVVARYDATDDPGVADAASEQIVLTLRQPYGNHNAGQLAFSPTDGYLYVGYGDGGSGGDPQNYSQNPRSLLGKMLRLDVDSASPYAIPADNPFAAEDDGVLDEIWAIGIRNPWRYSFDSMTGDLYIGDVGQGVWEEVSFQPAESAGGENYGWKVREGDHNYSSSTPWGPGIRTGPIYEYNHSSGAVRGRSITGGVVYRGCRMPDLQGRYFFADYESPSWIRSFRVVAGQAIDLANHTTEMNAAIPGSITRPTAFGSDASGEVYVVDHQSRTTSTDGRLYRIVPSNPPNNPPTARIVSTPDPAEVTLIDDEGEVLLDATSSDDGDDGTQTLTFSWEQLDGPDDGAEIARPEKESTLVRLTVSGSYRFRVTVDDGQDSSTADVSVEALPDPRVRFLRGDANVDDILDISDGTYVLGTLFLGFPDPSCADAMDTNDSGTVDLSDAVFLFGYLFTGGERPPEPGPVDCGRDPTDDDGVSCEAYPHCP